MILVDRGENHVLMPQRGSDTANGQQVCPANPRLRIFTETEGLFENLVVLMLCGCFAQIAGEYSRHALDLRSLGSLS
jgi:hypothetical protein